ncbi:MAG: hypothetical protein AABY22_08290 [Nanoarchaeota archaeon]
MKKQFKEIENKMRKAIDTEYSSKWKRVRCPSLKTMAHFINNVFIGYKAEIKRTMESKDGRIGHRPFVRQYYEGNELFVYDQNGNQIFRHNAVETYRRNVEVANWILNKLTDFTLLSQSANAESLIADKQNPQDNNNEKIVAD